MDEEHEQSRAVSRPPDVRLAPVHARARAELRDPSSSHVEPPRPPGFLAYLGPAVMVGVGYMDPGNWASDLEGGGRFGYELLWVLLVSNGMALLLQTLATRLGVVRGQGLAEACRAFYGAKLAWALWALAELAIVACDVAEVLGSAVALNLLFGIPMLVGASLTIGDVLVLMLLHRRRRLLERVVGLLVVAVAGCLLVELMLAHPSLAALVKGASPRLRLESLPVAVSIVGATVMPHNLYLHSALVASGRTPRARDRAEIRAALRANVVSTSVALNLAFLVNAAILVLAASALRREWAARGGIELQDACRLLAPLLGTGLAPVVFAIGLLCAGQSATVTGTLAGQAVMEGFVRIRISPVVRRLVTRAAALVPALGVLAIAGDRGVTGLLVGTQVVLSLQLPFAIVPLLRLTRARAVMGRHATSRTVTALGTAVGAAIVAANAGLTLDAIRQLRAHAPLAATALTVIALLGVGLLAWTAMAVPRATPEGEASAAADDAPLPSTEGTED